MPKHADDQPLKNQRGLSLMELLITILLGVMLIGVLGSLFSAGIKSNLYASRQTTLLLSAREALDSGSSMPGMARQARSALSSGGLSATQLLVNTPDGLSSKYSLSASTLMLTRSSQTFTLARNITALQVAYYNINSSGLIFASTQAASASLVTAWIQSTLTGGTTYTFYSAGRLRNHL